MSHAQKGGGDSPSKSVKELIFCPSLSLSIFPGKRNMCWCSGCLWARQTSPPITCAEILQILQKEDLPPGYRWAWDLTEMVSNRRYQMFLSHDQEKEFSIDLEQYLSNFCLPGMVRHIFYILSQYMQKCVGMGVGVFLKISSQGKILQSISDS